MGGSGWMERSLYRGQGEHQRPMVDLGAGKSHCTNWGMGNWGGLAFESGKIRGHMTSSECNWLPWQKKKMPLMEG